MDTKAAMTAARATATVPVRLASCWRVIRIGRALADSQIWTVKVKVLGQFDTRRQCQDPAYSDCHSATLQRQVYHGNDVFNSSR